MHQCLVTGSAGNLGQAVSQLAATAGWEVVGFFHEREPHNSHPQIRHVRCDLTNWSKIAMTLTDYDPFDLVVMAHGIQSPARLSELRRVDIDRLIGVNLLASIYLTSQLINERRLRPQALIVYCSSIQASTPRAGRSVYAASKGGLESLMRAAAVELADLPARAVALRLGQLTTPMRGISFSREEQTKLKACAPLGWIEPMQVAEFILALYQQFGLSGEVITLDGLQSLQVWRMP